MTSQQSGEDVGAIFATLVFEGLDDSSQRAGKFGQNLQIFKINLLEILLNFLKLVLLEVEMQAVVAILAEQWPQSVTIEAKTWENKLQQQFAKSHLTPLIILHLPQLLTPKLTRSVIWLLLLWSEYVKI
jgi:hypothetical protein